MLFKIKHRDTARTGQKLKSIRKCSKACTLAFLSTSGIVIGKLSKCYTREHLSTSGSLVKNILRHDTSELVDFWDNTSRLVNLSTLDMFCRLVELKEIILRHQASN